MKAGFTSPYPLNLPADAKKADATASSGASIASSRKTKTDDDETPRVSIETQQAFGKAGNEAASIAASKKSTPSIKSDLTMP